MPKVIGEYEWVFDDVQLGIDLKQFREENNLTQAQIAEYVGYETGSAIALIEVGKTPAGIPLYKFMRLCAIMDADPNSYFSIQKLD